MALRPFHRFLRLMRIQHAAPALAIFALLAAILLPAAHAYTGFDDACHSTCAVVDISADQTNAPCHDEHRAPQHDEHTCEFCHLIAITSVGIKSILDAPICTVLQATIALPSVEAQCPTSLDLPPSIPARGPPAA